MTINNKYNIGDIVYLRTDVDQDRYLVTEIYVSASAIAYRVTRGTYDYTAHEIELSREKDLLMTL